MTKFSEVFWDFFKRKFYYFLTSAGLLLVIFEIDKITEEMQRSGTGSLDQVAMIPGSSFLTYALGFFASILVLIKQEMLWRDKKVIGPYRQGELSFSKLLWANILSTLVYLAIVFQLRRIFWFITSLFNAKNPEFFSGKENWIYWIVTDVLFSTLLSIFAGIALHMVYWNVKKGLDLKLGKIGNIIYYGILTFIAFFVYVFIQTYIAILLFANFLRFPFTKSGEQFFLTTIIIYVVGGVIVVGFAVGLLRGYLKSEIPEIRKGVAEENTEVAK